MIELTKTTIQTGLSNLVNYPKDMSCPVTQPLSYSDITRIVPKKDESTIESIPPDHRFDPILEGTLEKLPLLEPVPPSTKFIHLYKPLEQRVYIDSTKLPLTLLTRGDINILKTDTSPHPSLIDSGIELQVFDTGFAGVAWTREEPFSKEMIWDFVIKLFEDLCLFLTASYRATTHTDRILAIITYVKLRHGNAPLLTSRIIKLYTDKLKTLFGMEIQFDVAEFARDARARMNNFEEMRNSPIWEKIYNFGCFSLAHSLFSRAGIDFESFSYDAMEAAIITKKFSSKTDMVVCFADTALFICEKGAQIFTTGDLGCLYHSESTYEMFFKQATELKRQAPLLDNSEAHGINMHTYHARLEDSIEKGDDMYKHAVRMGERERKTLFIFINDLKVIQNDLCSKKAAGENRVPPFSILVNGPSSIGKSSIMNMIRHYYAMHENLERGSEFTYSRNAAAKFWDGFTSKVWCLIMDDIGFMNPNFAVGGDPTVMEILQIINSVPFVPDQAALENKGRIPLRVKLVVASTNTRELNCDKYFSCPGAAQRRFPYCITPSVRPEFLTKDGTGLDSSKVDQTDGFQDLWTFKITKVEPHVDLKRNAIHRTVHEGIGMRGLLEWLDIAITEHNRNQSVITRSNKKLNASSMCETCKLPNEFCKCAEKSEKVEIQGNMVSGSLASVVPIGKNWCDTCKDFDWKCNHNMRWYNGAYVCEPSHLPMMLYDLQQFYPFSTSFLANIRMDDELAKLTEMHARYGRMSPGPEREALLQVIGITNNGLEVMREVYILSREKKICDYNTYDLKVWQTFEERVTQKPAPELRIMNTGDYDDLLLLQGKTEGSNMYTFISLSCTLYCGYKLCVKISDIITYADTALEIANTVFDYNTRINTTIAKITNAPLNICELDAAWFRKQGAMVQRVVYKHSSFLMACAAALVIGISTMKLTSSVFNLQGNMGSAPVANEVEKDNVWFNPDIPLHTLETTPQSKCTDYTTLRTKVANNTVHLVTSVEVNGKIKKYICKGVCVKARVYMFDNHTIPVGDHLTDITNTIVSPGISTNVKQFLRTESCVLRYPDIDICFIKISIQNPCKSIVEYFTPTDEFTLASSHGEYISRNADGEVIYKTVKGLVKTNLILPNGVGKDSSTYTGTVDVPTVQGDCGSPLITKTIKGVVIIGMHVAYDTINNKTVTHHVSGDLIRVSIAKLDPYGPLQASYAQLDSGDNKVVISDLHHKSTMRYLVQGNLMLFGSKKDFRPASKSKVIPSFAHKEFEKIGFKTTCGPPVMKGWRPWRRTAECITNTGKTINSGILDKCIDSYVNDMISRMPAKEMADVKVYDMFTAVNGAAGIGYVDTIKRTTSAGSPWACSKAKFLTKTLPERGLMDPVEVDKEILDRSAAIESRYRSGERVYPLFSSHLKDEPTSFKNIAIAKTRVFSGAPFDWSLVVRKYTLAIIRLFQNNKFVSEMCPGTTCQSKEWGEIRAYLTEFGELQIIAGDFRTYDKTMAAEVIYGAYVVIIKMCEHSGNFSEEDIRVLRGIGTDTSYSLTEFFADIFALIGSNPSGHPLTVIINCIVNSLYMRYSYYILNPEHEVETFTQRVKLMTYGDDNVMGVSKQISWFNHTTLQEVLAGIGIEYTMADKEAASVPYIHIDEVSFLKRFWVWNDDLNDYGCKLEMSSLHKMLMMWVPSTTVCPEIQTLAVMESALSEFFYYGKEEFQLRRKQFSSICVKLNLLEFNGGREFPTYQDHIDRWKSSGVIVSN